MLDHVVMVTTQLFILNQRLKLLVYLHAKQTLKLIQRLTYGTLRPNAASSVCLMSAYLTKLLAGGEGTGQQTDRQADRKTEARIDRPTKSSWI